MRRGVSGGVAERREAGVVESNHGLHFEIVVISGRGGWKNINREKDTNYQKLRVDGLINSLCELN